MAIRAKDTGSVKATSWVDITGLFLWIFTMLVFVVPFLLAPFHWMENEAIDWLLAWYIANVIADVLPAISIIFFFWYLIIAIGSGQEGSDTTCDVNGNNCTFNKSYFSAKDGWLTWAIFTILSGVQYWLMFWFGADAIRYLRPNGGYEVKFLWPSLIYDLLVIVGRAPDASREVKYHAEVYGDETSSDTV